MGNVTLTTFYPNNGTTDATEVNANSSALNGSTSGLNAENIRSEGIDYRQLNGTITLISASIQQNGYQLSLGSNNSANAKYSSFANYSVKESEINHDNTGATNTVIGKGTKLQIGGAIGHPLVEGEIITINWNVIQWAEFTDVAYDLLESALIDTATKDGGAGATHPYGSGIGEWCWLIYPKFNTTSNSYNDSDYDDAKTANIVAGTDFLDPAGNSGGVGGFQAFNTVRWDHVSVVPAHFLTATDSGAGPVEMIVAHYDGPDNTSKLAGPQLINGSLKLKVKASPATRLYSVQLYVSGYWRMECNTSGVDPVSGPNTAGMYLEDDEANPTGGGNPAAVEYGVSGKIGLERAELTVLIESPKGA
jgi:hypothetical protein